MMTEPKSKFRDGINAYSFIILVVVLNVVSVTLMFIESGWYFSLYSSNNNVSGRLLGFNIYVFILGIIILILTILVGYYSMRQKENLTNEILFRTRIVT